MEAPKEFSSPPAKLPKLKFNKRIQVVLICLFVSIVFWFLIAMSKSYTDKFDFPVSYVNFPDQRVVMNELPPNISISVRTTGFRILTHHFAKSQEPVVVDVGASLAGINDTGNEMISVPSKSFTADFSQQLGSEYAILDFSPDSIIFSFSQKTGKRVPVVLNSRITLEKQFDTVASPVLTPDSVFITGPADVIAATHQVQTDLLQLNEIREDILATVPLKKDHLIATNVGSIEVKIPVEKFTEGTAEVAVHVINVKSGYSLRTFPDKVNVRYRVSLGKYNEVTPEMFDAVVDASGLPNEHISELKVKLETAPDFIRIVRIEPEKTDYILRK